MSRLQHFHSHTGLSAVFTLLTSVSAVLMLGFCSCRTPGMTTCVPCAPCASSCATENTPCTVAVPTKVIIPCKRTPAVKPTVTCVKPSYVKPTCVKPTCTKPVCTESCCLPRYQPSCQPVNAIPGCGAVGTQPACAPASMAKSGQKVTPAPVLTPAPAPVHNSVPGTDSLLQDPQIPATKTAPQKVTPLEASVKAEIVEVPESLDAALDTQIPKAAELPSELPAELPSETPVGLPEVPEETTIPVETPVETPIEAPAEIPVEPILDELLPLEEATLLETGAMMKPRKNVPGGARVLEVPRKGEVTTPAASVEPKVIPRKDGSAIKFQKFTPNGPELELEIEDASTFSRNVYPEDKKFAEPRGKKAVLSPLLKVETPSQVSATEVVSSRWNISVETLRVLMERQKNVSKEDMSTLIVHASVFPRGVVRTLNHALKKDYDIQLTAAEMPIQAGSGASRENAKPAEIAMPNESAIAARLMERPSYAEPADEYIIDTTHPASRRDLGSAKKMKVGGAEIEDNWQADTQDQSGTFIYYNNAQGRSTVQSPDPVYIYAPRFRSVRQIVDLNIDSQVMSTGDISNPEEIFIQGRNTGTDTAKQNAQTHTESGRATLIQAQGAMGSGQVDGAIAPQAQNQEAVIAQENRTIVGPQASAGKTRANTASGLIELSTWTKTDGLQVFIEKESASAAVRNESAPSLYTVKEGENKQDVRIYKVASKTNAKPGEMVDFIIYFENTGTAPVGNITLVDNLPARLEIVADSAESSVDSSFTYEINGTGSQTLRWEVTQPLYAGEKGAVKFRALVR